MSHSHAAQVNSNAQLIARFYEALDKHDADAVDEVYHDDATFHDPVFGNLDAQRVRGMWRMFCGRSRDFTMTVRDIDADENRGSAVWESNYTFTATGRQVHNVARAEFEFADGRIIRHRDTFDVKNWASQAFPRLSSWLIATRPGVVLFRRRANKTLEDFLSTKGTGDHKAKGGEPR